MNNPENCQVEPLEKPLDQVTLSKAAAVYLAVWGMGCPQCAIRVSNELLSLDDVLFVKVLLEKGLAIVAYNPECILPDDLATTVAAAGNDGRHHYRARVVGQVPAAQALLSLA